MKKIKAVIFFILSAVVLAFDNIFNPCPCKRFIKKEITYSENLENYYNNQKLHNSTV